MIRIGLLSDEALGEPGGRQEDGLGFDAYARVLAQGALQASGPLTIGVFGDWGSGKTSLMRLILREVARRPEVVPVWFNVWQYEQEEHPVIALVGTIIRELERREQNPGRAARAAGALIKALKSVAYAFSLKSTVKLPGMVDVELSVAGRDVADRNRELQEDALLAQSLFHEAFRALESVEFADEVRVVVFIDDLDRCFPDRAVKLLESIKLVLAQRGFVFVLGVAHRVIQGYLEHRYSTDYGVVDYKGRLYLDKMVQVEFQIPPGRGRMKEFCEVLLRGQPPEVADQLRDVLPLVGRALEGRPRAVVRFLNSLLVDLAISAELDAGAVGHGAAGAGAAGGPETGGRIPVQFFALSRCLQQRWPEVLRELMASDELARNVARWDRQQMREASRASNQDRGGVASSLLSDRDLEELLKSPEGMGWLQDAALRRASVDFLRAQSRVRDGAQDVRGYDVALCYAPEDREPVAGVAEILADYGLRVLMPQHWSVPAGTPEQDAEPASRQARFVLVFAGPPPGLPSAQRAELAALTRASGPRLGPVPRIIPVLLPGGSVHSLPDELHGLSALDLRNGLSVEVLRPVVDAIRAG